MGAKLPEALRRRWFGTHFFNPPRYMRLVEIIATPEADPAAVDALAHFVDQRLGKDVVFARDTPNFIANRIGVFIMLEAIRLMQSEDLTIEEVDALTGTGHRLAAHRHLPPVRPGGAGRDGARGQRILPACAPPRKRR